MPARPPPPSGASERAAGRRPSRPVGASIVLTWADGAALLAVLVWGVSFPVLKALMTVMDPLVLMLVQWLVALAVLATALAADGRVATSGARGAPRAPDGRPGQPR